MRSIVLGGLLLPLRLYLQPTRFANEVAALAPDLPRDYSLIQARHKLRDPMFRSCLTRLLLQAVIALVWAPFLAGVLALFGFPVGWVAVALGLTGGVVIGVAVGVTLGMTGGVAFGVTFGVALGLTGGVATDVATGMAAGMVGGVAAGVAAGVAFGVAFRMTISVVLVVVGGVVTGVTSDVATGMVTGVAAALTTTHLLHLPFQLIISPICWAVVQSQPRLGPVLWQIIPVHWDEVILLPLPGLVGLLVTLYREDPALGGEAITEVAAHRYQSRAAPAALLRLALEDARSIASLPALGAFQYSLSWLSEDTALPQATKTRLLRMRDISQEVTSASKSDSATNRVRRLTDASSMLESLRLQPDVFGTALVQWSAIIAAGLDEARREQREQEPIPQVYRKDGRPIHPGSSPDMALPFKGRRALFRQLEADLGGKASERATLVLYGQRRTGKTSTLLQLPHRLGSRLVPAFLDLQSEKLGGARDTAGLLSGLAEGIVEEARRNRGITLPALDQTALISNPYPALGRWLDQVEQTLGDRTLLLCLDEFEELEKSIRSGRLDTRILSTLRNVVQHRSQIAVLLSGSHQIDELPPHWASALVTTTTLPISFLDEANARELIERPIEDFPAIYTATAVDRIIEVTHCQPYLIQLLCALLVDRLNAARRSPPESFVTVDDVNSVIPDALERGAGYFSDLWHTQVSSEYGRQVLEALAQAPGDRLARVALRGVTDDMPALRAAVATLLRREIIEPDSDGYRISVPLVAAYARAAAIL